MCSKAFAWTISDRTVQIDHVTKGGVGQALCCDIPLSASFFCTSLIKDSLMAHANTNALVSPQVPVRHRTPSLWYKALELELRLNYSAITRKFQPSEWINSSSVKKECTIFSHEIKERNHYRQRRPNAEENLHSKCLLVAFFFFF